MFDTPANTTAITKKTDTTAFMQIFSVLGARKCLTVLKDEGCPPH
ncbi:hypothetical protein GbCGDNIH6_8184 [Granulibacter bethesdensis]|nr:hypothetical protein GbCGDNIH6_8184 [Granulibacter bethesdensis]